jgi:hypothetical protein
MPWAEITSEDALVRPFAVTLTCEAWGQAGRVEVSGRV